MDSQIVTEGSKIPGDLAVPDAPIEITAHRIENIYIDLITPFAVISDFSDSKAMHPMMIQTPQGFFCVDGYNKVEAAKAEGTETITVEIIEVNGHSDIDIVLRKINNRLESRGSTPEYANIIVVVREAYDFILNSGTDVKLFSHGGVRVGAQFVNDRSVDVKELLVARIGRSRNKVNEYLNYSRYIDHPTLKTLSDARISRRFFDLIHPEKSSLIKTLQEKKLSEEVIMATVSRCVLACHEEYLRGGKIYFPTEQFPALLQENENTGGGSLTTEKNRSLRRSTQEPVGKGLSGGRHKGSRSPGQKGSSNNEPGSTGGEVGPPVATQIADALTKCGNTLVSAGATLKSSPSITADLLVSLEAAKAALVRIIELVKANLDGGGNGAPQAGSWGN